MRRIIPFIIAASIVTACSSIDCPLHNTVMTKYVFGGNVDEFEDTLYVSISRTDQPDTLLLNRFTGGNEFLIPVSYHQSSDVLFFTFTGNGVTKTDTVTIEKTNTPHFESVDCGPAFFHTINHVSWTHHAIDSIVITKAEVNYDTSKGHLLLYLKRYR